MRNLYLIVGIRGAFSPATTTVPQNLDVALSHTLDDRWGVVPPWGPCDSAADLTTAGDEILRAWNHVDLRINNDATPEDIPAAGLFRTTWDTLELFGRVNLAGVDAKLPLDCAGRTLSQRVENSVLRDKTRKRIDRLVQVRVARSVGGNTPIPQEKVVRELTAILDIRVYPEDAWNAQRESPVDMFAVDDERPLHARVPLPDWTIDDAAWLTEALALSCRRSGMTQDDVMISIRSRQ